MNVLITGASRGLGLEVCKQQLQSGNNVYLISRSRTKELDHVLQNHPGRAFHLEFDLARVDDIKKHVFTDWIGQETPIHALICNAAVAYDDLASNANLDAVNAMFQINVLAPMALTKCTIRNMLYHHVAGSIVFVSSICARKGYKGLSMYAATKGAIESFSRGIAREWGSKGIRSNCVVPGFMETDMSATLTEEQRSKIFQRTSLGMATDIGSVASTIQFLLGPQSKSITGQDIVVDCGTI